MRLVLTVLSCVLAFPAAAQSVDREQVNRIIAEGLNESEVTQPRSSDPFEYPKDE